MDYLIANPSIFFILLNLIILFLWLPLSLYGLFKRNYALFLFGMALFSLFSYNWLLVIFGMGFFSEFKYNIFFQLLFLYAFFLLYLRIYEEREALGLASNLFHNSSKITSFKDSIIRQLDVFSWLGGTIFFIALYVLIGMSESAAIVALFTFLFFLTMYFRVEKKCFYLEKDYAYFGSSWTQGKTLRSFRLFTFITALLFIFHLFIAFGHFFKLWDFEEAFMKYINIFFLIQTITILFLLFFVIQLFITKKRFEKNLAKYQNHYKVWFNQVLRSFEKVTQDNHPHYYYPTPNNKADYGILHVFRNILQKSQAELMYLVGDNDDWPNLRLTARKPSLVGLHSAVRKKTLFDLNSFDSEYYFSGLTNLIKKNKPFFFSNIRKRSFSFQRHFSKLVQVHPEYSLDSLIVYPFNHLEKPACLVLINPQFIQECAFQPIEEIFLHTLTNDLATLNFSRLEELKQEVQGTQKIKTNSQNLRDFIPTLEREEFNQTNNQYSQNQVEERLEELNYQEEDILEQADKTQENIETQPEVDSYQIFSHSKNKEKFIKEEKIENAYSKNIEKIHNLFKPDKNRDSDRIEYYSHYLFKNKMPNSIALVTNTGEKGKLFVFNELVQDPSLIATSNLTLQNLFYRYLPKKDVMTFIREWNKGFNPFSNKDICQSLAMSFNPEEQIMSYYNAGVKNAYCFNSANEIFSPLRLHQSKVPLSSINLNNKKAVKLDLHPGDFILAFSDGIKSIKNRAGKRLENSILFNSIKKNKNGNPEELINSLIEEIEEFSFSIPNFQQTFFIVKVQN